MFRETYLSVQPLKVNFVGERKAFKGLNLKVVAMSVHTVNKALFISVRQLQ